MVTRQSFPRPRMTRKSLPSVATTPACFALSGGLYEALCNRGAMKNKIQWVNKDWAGNLDCRGSRVCDSRTHMHEQKAEGAALVVDSLFMDWSSRKAIFAHPRDNRKWECGWWPALL